MEVRVPPGHRRGNSIPATPLPACTVTVVWGSPQGPGAREGAQLENAASPLPLPLPALALALRALALPLSQLPLPLPPPSAPPVGLCCSLQQRQPAPVAWHDKRGSCAWTRRTAIHYAHSLFTEAAPGTFLFWSPAKPASDSLWSGLRERGCSGALGSHRAWTCPSREPGLVEAAAPAPRPLL